MIIDLYRTSIHAKNNIMKNSMLYLIAASFLLLLYPSRPALSQEKTSSTVHITITGDDGVSTDTTFKLKEGQDPDMIKEIVSRLAGEEMHVAHMSQDVHVSHKGDREMVWVSDGGNDMTWLSGHEIEGINLDSIKAAHKDAKVLVVKKKDGEITVKELDDEEDIHMDDESGTDLHEMMFIQADKDGDIVHIKKTKSGKKVMMISEDGDVNKKHRVIVLTDKDDGEGKEKEIEVIVHGDEDMEWIEQDEGDVKVDVYVIKKDDGKEVEVVKKKKVKVKIEEEDPVGEKTEKGMKEKKK